MVSPVKLPWELEEDILSRLPVQSLARFRSVCRRFNALLDEKWFVNNHSARARPQFILLTSSNIYSIEIIGLDGVDPKIKLRELGSSDIPYPQVDLSDITISTCDGFLFCDYLHCPKATMIWSPWLKQLKWIEYENKEFNIVGLGYDNTKPEKVYKILGFFWLFNEVLRNYHQRVQIYDCACHAFKFIDIFDEDRLLPDTVERLSLNGNLYWLSPIPNTDDIFIQSFDFSKEILKPLCLLPFQKNDVCEVMVLTVFEGDRFSLLKECFVTWTIEIWVTKKKIDISYNNGEEVVWINLLSLPSYNLIPSIRLCFGFSYFIYDKTTLIMCIGAPEPRAASIYIIREEFFMKFETESGYCVVIDKLAAYFEVELKEVKLSEGYYDMDQAKL